MAGELYAALGVGKDATAGAITRAYRALSLTHHPDRGGDRAAFDRVNAAHEVLSDPARRAHYDATGETARPRDAAREAALRLLAEALAAVVKAVAEGRRPVKHEDMKEHVRAAVEAKRREVRAALDEMKRIADALHESAERFTVEGDAENLMAAVARSHLALVEREKAQLEALAAGAGRALEILATHGFRVVPRPAPAWGSAATAATWSIT